VVGSLRAARQHHVTIVRLDHHDGNVMEIPLEIRAVRFINKTQAHTGHAALPQRAVVRAHSAAVNDWIARIGSRVSQLAARLRNADPALR
jgi:hypothetical protein